MRALIVDDSRFLRERLKGLLQPMDWTFSEAANGVEALTTLRSGETFDLILLDVNMPEMGGMECVRRLREERLAPQTPVMMVTTEADASYIAQALDYGADEFLMKPVIIDTLRTKLLLLGLAPAKSLQHVG